MSATVFAIATVHMSTIIILDCYNIPYRNFYLFSWSFQADFSQLKFKVLSNIFEQFSRDIMIIDMTSILIWKSLEAQHTL